MSAALAEDLSHHPVDLAANDAPTPATSPRCTAPEVPTSGGPRDNAASCFGTARAAPRLVEPTAQPAPRPPRCPEVTARARDGSEYKGNLLHDILVYRSLRARQMQGRALLDRESNELSQLESSLRPEAVSVRDDGRATRQFLRWETNAVAGVTLHTSTGDETDGLPVDTVDLGAGGICVVTELTLQAGDEITIRIRAGQDGERAVTMPSRVAWAAGRRVGLMFAGGPAWP